MHVPGTWFFGIHRLAPRCGRDVLRAGELEPHKIHGTVAVRAADDGSDAPLERVSVTSEHSEDDDDDDVWTGADPPETRDGRADPAL